ncbi:hypothetical protein Mesil_1220 [Allomeiothermus silvanus DSM 9946]|uniref:Hydrazine synthase alpha subunit middle domain-containing protein n=1 Tax=Allomeiothermus silvanus (strain ATCC 700542 / DSM 9946 / NBRC 106475 / NCIMB 13440 / VI-R2) TaxID=526227 RepID=D7BDW6_ALLS1|nr:hypothetical protein [Allomeiothermus silvanus]ADH63117.1 hypothetical protein Mesil_1220 [Allomeiothermus silvanus DSM 9946]
MRAKLALAALLAVGLTQSANPPKSVQLECPAEVNGPIVECKLTVTGLPLGSSAVKAILYPADKTSTVSRQVRVNRVAANVAAQPTLLSSYWHRKILSSGTEGAPGVDQTEIRDMRYLPRQLVAGTLAEWENGLPQNFYVSQVPPEYQGADLLVTRNYGTYGSAGYANTCWTRFTLNRSAKVILLMFSERPAWVDDTWTVGPAVGYGRKGSDNVLSTTETADSYFKVFREGSHCLPGQGAPGRIYQIAFMEADGSPSKPPAVPAGLPVPQPNTYCPQWVHDQYKDWHPQIDPVYWCYFGHEHGSDPAQFPKIKALLDSGAINLTFGRVEQAGNATPMCVSCHQQKLGRSRVEAPRESYKLFALDDRQGHLWLIKFELSSHNRARLCQRHHEYGIWAVDSNTGELLAALQFASDFGPALNASVGNNTRYKPDLCPENVDIPMNNDQGRHRIPLISAAGYENWTPHFPPQLGFYGYGRSYNLDNPMTRCSDEVDADGFYTCNQAVRALDPNNYNWGDNRWFIIPGGDQPDGGFGIRASTAIASGTFCTDVLGTTLRDCTAPDAVQQYIKPGLDILHKDQFRWIPYDPWWVEYKPVPSGFVNFDTHNLEGALRAPN